MSFVMDNFVKCRTLLLLVTTVFGFAPASTMAEGACPPGYYPIGGQGVQGCAPIPGAAGGSAPAPAATGPSGRWNDTWGAIAESPSTELIGAGKNQSSRARAEREALRKCSSEGARDCKVLVAYKNQCAAMLAPTVAGNGSHTGAGRGPTLNEAIGAAKQACVDGRGGQCRVLYTDCAEPTFEKF